jgi:hypothetical protein
MMKAGSIPEIVRSEPYGRRTDHIFRNNLPDLSSSITDNRVFPFSAGCYEMTIKPKNMHETVGI